MNLSKVMLLSIEKIRLIILERNSLYDFCHKVIKYIQTYIEKVKSSFPPKYNILWNIISSLESSVCLSAYVTFLMYLF